jgi:hypothetical protein
LTLPSEDPSQDELAPREDLGQLLLQEFTSLLNVTQVPTIVIINSDTDRPLSRESALAIEWNDPHDCFNKDGFNAWQAGGSGMTVPWLPVKVTALSSDQETTPGRS